MPLKQLKDMDEWISMLTRLCDDKQRKAQLWIYFVVCIIPEALFTIID